MFWCIDYLDTILNSNCQIFLIISCLQAINAIKAYLFNRNPLHVIIIHIFVEFI